jgi:DNA-binding NtrC family response regulator
MIMTDGSCSPVGVRGLNEATALPVTLKEARKALGRDMLERALKTHGGKVTAAAKELGISAPDLLRTDGEAGHRQGWLKVRRGFGVF